jgi:hypothetical protein
MRKICNENIRALFAISFRKFSQTVSAVEQENKIRPTFLLE